MKELKSDERIIVFMCKCRTIRYLASDIAPDDILNTRKHCLRCNTEMLISIEDMPEHNKGDRIDVPGYNAWQSDPLTPKPAG